LELFNAVSIAKMHCQSQSPSKHKNDETTLKMNYFELPLTVGTAQGNSKSA